MKVWPGEPYPLGATFDGSGTNFSVFSEAAQRVQLCLFDEDGNQECISLPEVTGHCWHGYLPQVIPGQRYGYRVFGPWDPARGIRCCPSKLLLDPYAKAIDGDIKWDDSLFPNRPDMAPDALDDRDTAKFMPKCVVINPFFDWSKDRPPRTPLHETTIYEAHVKGLTMLMSKIPPELRGTYAGLSEPAILDHLAMLGVTAIELLPVHQFVHDRALVENSLRNYWGYNSIGYFAPHNEYSSTGQAGQQVQEFKQMVLRMHEAGIEVILDVVYNHTAEGNHYGPVLSMKGLDNFSYYRLNADDMRYYMDYTGTGNTLNMRHPHVLQLVMDSLRYWVTEMHVDGFRFDLAATLARTLHDVDKLSTFFDIIQQDPIISQVKLIAEPWDVGMGGYQVGNFPPQWSEWNGMYRDSVRDYWRGADRTLGELANRFTGSSDLYENTRRRPHASVNFITCHDGFTLRDLVSYNHKHNEANKEDNRDGSDDNRSWNCGTEGPTDDPQVCELRSRQQRNFLATLIFSQGVPMICSGDEIGKTQGGNNNAYCQDNPISWLDWDNADEDLLEFVACLVQLRKEHPVFRKWKWFEGGRGWGRHQKDIGWYRPDGVEMSQKDWETGHFKSLQLFLSGVLKVVDQRGQEVTDDDFLVLFNASDGVREFKLVSFPLIREWRVEISTAAPKPCDDDEVYKPGQVVPLPSRSLMVLKNVRQQQ
ncbi:MAG: glycogen debranching protein GlgX [Planctomycetes bacterium]|nr:glycogen debranching protein GlgX [Planctomycetota bacterium]